MQEAVKQPLPLAVRLIAIVVQNGSDAEREGHFHGTFAASAKLTEPPSYAFDWQLNVSQDNSLKKR